MIVRDLKRRDLKKSETVGNLKYKTLKVKSEWENLLSSRAKEVLNYEPSNDVALESTIALSG